MQPLTISFLQSNLFWENKEKNLSQFSEKIASLPKESQVVVLPEMFTTGFSMMPSKLAETMEGTSVQWMREKARENRKIITGSLIIEEDGKYFNRLIWMMPNGVHYQYDKRHLFAYAGEDKHFSAGNKRLIVQVNGWKICLMVCYDLRFPVWARQKPNTQEAINRYDILIYVANWPEKRSLSWKALLQARAIENQCYVAGVNRVGNDGNNVHYNGDSSLIDPLGNIIWQQRDEETSFTHVFNKAALKAARAQFPFLDDADDFMLL